MCLCGKRGYTGAVGVEPHFVGVVDEASLRPIGRVIQKLRHGARCARAGVHRRFEPALEINREIEAVVRVVFFAQSVVSKVARAGGLVDRRCGAISTLHLASGASDDRSRPTLLIGGHGGCNRGRAPPNQTRPLGRCSRRIGNLLVVGQRVDEE